MAMFIVTCFWGWQRGEANPRITVRKLSFSECRVWALGFGRRRCWRFEWKRDMEAKRLTSSLSSCTIAAQTIPGSVRCEDLHVGR
jgi:hypothetical protein